VAAAAPVVYFKNYDSIQCFDRNLFHFTNLSSVKFGSITYLWNFGDGDTSIALNPTHHYNTIDTFTVKLIGTTNYGCTDSFKWHTYLKNGVRPLATFTLNDTNQCLKGNNFVFTNTSTIAAGTIVDQIWSFDDGDTSHKHDVNHIYLVDGIKNSKLFVRSDAGCTDSVIHPLLVAPKPRAAFLQNDSTQCLNENIFAYNNTTSISLGTYNSFWDFDDGAVSLLKSPSHTFSQVLTYSVMLLTVSDLGCRDSVTHTSTTFPVPDAKLDLKSDTIQCFKGNKFSFSDKSTMSGGTIIANLWRFGDGNSVMNDPAPFHSYNDTGTYNVSLVIASSNICYDTANVVVTVADGPVVDFAVNDSTQCLGGNGFAFTNNSSIGIGTLSYLWKFGDGDTSTMINPVHSYTYQNTFNVKLIAKSSIGCSDSNSHNMYVANMQKAGFTINDSDQCLKNNFFQFMNTTTPMIPGTMFYWEFGNGDTSTAVHPSYIYTTTGTFQVKLKILTGNGCDDSIMKNVYVGISQQTSFDVNDTMQCLSGNVFNFTNTSSISVGTLTYLWDFGNNQTSTQTNPSFSFITDGTHPVKLISASSQGCTDSIIRNVYIMPAQTTSFTVNDTSQCLTGNQFIFTNTSSFPSGTLTYLWDFGNGNTSTSVNISYSYIVKGKYTVKLVSVSDINCRDSAFQDVYIGDPPTADFDVNDSSQCLAGNNFVFTNQSTAPSGTIIGAYAWYFGDGSSSAAANPNYTYAVPDTFNVKLVAKTTGGCDDSITKMVYVRPMPKADFTMNSNPQNLFGNNFVFTNTSTILNGSLTSAWDFGDGNTATTTNASHSYTTADTFPVRLLLTSDHGCTDTIIKPAYVTSGPPPSINVDFTFQNACVGEPVLFINTSTVNQDSFMNFFWDFGDTTQTIIRTNPTHVYKYTGTYLVKLRGVTWGGMQDSTSQLITIYNKPTLNISYSPDTIGIIGEKITLTANGSFNTLLWSTGEQTSSILVDKTGIYAVKVFNTTNCSATDSIFIEFVMQEVLEAMTLFTPNGDGYNDYFKVLNIDLFRPLKLVIYNRWGNELFSSENYMNDWDGKYKGQELPEGTYYYVIIDRNGTVYKGAVSLMQDGY
jgi:gliding motility-associated-like protein